MRNSILLVAILFTAAFVIAQQPTPVKAEEGLLEGTTSPVVMHFSQTAHTGPVPGAESIKALDDYFKWRRTPEGVAWAK